METRVNAEDSLAEVLVTIDCDSQHLTLKHHLAINKALKLKLSQLSSTYASNVCDKIETTTGEYGLSKSNFVHPPKPQIVTTNQVVFSGVKATKLRASFTLNHAGHQRKARHVPCRPEFLRRDIFEAHDRVRRFINVDDPRQLFHFMALWIDAANIFQTEDRIRKIELTHVDKRFGWHLAGFLLATTKIKRDGTEKHESTEAHNRANLGYISKQSIRSRLGIFY
jgi:hypothetical protein